MAINDPTQRGGDLDPANSGEGYHEDARGPNQGGGGDGGGGDPERNRPRDLRETPAPDAPRGRRASLTERLRERAPVPLEIPERALKNQTRRDFLIYGAGVIAAGAGLLYAAPGNVREAFHLPMNVRNEGRKTRLLNKAIAFDDDVARALYSPQRLVPVYDRTLAQSPERLMNNYNGPTPGPGYLDHWHVTLAGLASGHDVKLTLADIVALTQRAGGRHEQVTQLTCVEGWRAIAWWGGLRFADLLTAFPPRPDATWARLDSSVNLDTDMDGNPIPDPYYVAIDLPTARHPQTLLATHQSDRPLTLGHGAPLRLIAPMKLGLKNIKAITKITYSAHEPADYWYERGYSQYDGL